MRADIAKLEELAISEANSDCSLGSAKAQMTITCCTGPRGPSAAGADFGIAGDRATKTRIAG